MVAEDGSAADIFLGVGGDGAFGFAKGGEAVEFDFGAFDRERLCFDGHMAEGSDGAGGYWGYWTQRPFSI